MGKTGFQTQAIFVTCNNFKKTGRKLQKMRKSCNFAPFFREILQTQPILILANNYLSSRPRLIHYAFCAAFFFFSLNGSFTRSTSIENTRATMMDAIITASGSCHSITFEDRCMPFITSYMTMMM